jgi:hypothetical protein
MYEIEAADIYVDMNRVVEMYLKGTTNATAIAKALDIPRKDVLNHIDEWRRIAANTDAIKDRASEALTAMDKHYDLIIAEMWDIVHGGADERVRATTLKAIADVEAKRQETLQKAGLYDDAGISEELVAMEERVEAIERLLVSVAQKYPETKIFIMEGLSKASGPVSIEDTVQSTTVDG